MYLSYKQLIFVLSCTFFIIFYRKLVSQGTVVFKPLTYIVRVVGYVEKGTSSPVLEKYPNGVRRSQV